jgi:uncharacterized protein GlcG (DUF336 family)
MSLTLVEANRMVAAAIARAREMNIGMSIAVVDAGGHLLAFNRIEDSMWLAAHAAQGKAVATSAMGWPSADIPADNPVVQGIIASLGGRMVPAQGAVPVHRDGVLIGAIGGSGGTSEQDEECAKAGLAAL